MDDLHEMNSYNGLYRLGQILNLYWEKTPESVFYCAVQNAVASMDDIFLVDYTSTEDLLTPALDGTFTFSTF